MEDAVQAVFDARCSQRRTRLGGLLDFHAERAGVATVECFLKRAIQAVVPGKAYGHPGPGDCLNDSQVSSY